MGSLSAAALGFIIEYSIWVCSNNRIDDSLYDAVVRVIGQVVEEAVNGLIGTLSGWWLVSTYGVEGHEKFVIHWLYIEEYCPQNGLDPFDVFSIKTWDSCFL